VGCWAHCWGWHVGLRGVVAGGLLVGRGEGGGGGAGTIVGGSGRT